MGQYTEIDYRTRHQWQINTKMFCVMLIMLYKDKQ